MTQELMRKAVESVIKKQVPDFEVGDTVGVHCRIVEGDKERTQIFTGTVISRRGTGISEMFTVRRIVNNEGVERIFPLHSPKVGAVDVVRSGRTRRAKLYFLRDRVGKATRLQEGRRVGKAAKAIVVPGEEAAAAPAAEATKS